MTEGAKQGTLEKEQRAARRPGTGGNARAGPQRGAPPPAPRPPPRPGVEEAIRGIAGGGHGGEPDAAGQGAVGGAGGGEYADAEEGAPPEGPSSGAGGPGIGARVIGEGGIPADVPLPSAARVGRSPSLAGVSYLFPCTRVQMSDVTVSLSDIDEGDIERAAARVTSTGDVLIRKEIVAALGSGATPRAPRSRASTSRRARQRTRS